MALLRPGDWLTLAAATAATVLLTWQLWGGSQARTVLIRAGGKPFRELSLLHRQRVAVPGPLGVTVVEVDGGRARIASDPSPRQYCVRQGWLSQAGQVAICLPNATSIELVGEARYDSLNF